jgi:lysophospholipase
VAYKTTPYVPQAARMKNGSVVDLLISAGANLGGSDIEGGFANVAIEKAIHHGDERAIQVWKRSGITPDKKHIVRGEDP